VKFVFNWYVKLKNAAIEFKFCAKLNDVLKDKFVSGLRAGKVFNWLCEEYLETKKLKTMEELALKYESTVVNSMRDVNVVNTYKGKKNTMKTRGYLRTKRTWAMKEQQFQQEQGSRDHLLQV